jgi:tetratricopeptide (TPR) repeat protein
MQFDSNISFAVTKLHMEGRHLEAIEIEEKRLEYYRNKIPVDDQNIISSLMNLAESYCDEDRNIEALKLFEEALEIRKRILPSNHPDIGISILSVAKIYYKNGEYEKAKDLKEQCKIFNIGFLINRLDF